MNRLRKTLFPIAAFVLLSFLSVLLAETFHHHEGVETDNDCAFCSFQLTASQAPSVSPPPVLMLQFLVFSFVFIFPLLYLSPVFRFSSGRSPPSILL
jgi:hypothetical protein